MFFFQNADISPVFIYSAKSSRRKFSRKSVTKYLEIFQRFSLVSPCHKWNEAGFFSQTLNVGVVPWLAEWFTLHDLCGTERVINAKQYK